MNWVVLLQGLYHFLDAAIMTVVLHAALHNEDRLTSPLLCFLFHECLSNRLCHFHVQDCEFFLECSILWGNNSLQLILHVNLYCFSVLRKQYHVEEVFHVIEQNLALHCCCCSVELRVLSLEMEVVRMEMKPLHHCLEYR
uniref:Putative secreted protein n=1 Tax=Anopheles marajoara TaxID=58244 RepID=A0A2M4C766_9DIPT